MLKKLVALSKGLVESFEGTVEDVGKARASGRDVLIHSSLLGELKKLIEEAEKLLEEGVRDTEKVVELIAELASALSNAEPVVTVPAEGASPPPTGVHKRWENQLANQVVEPLHLFYPTSLNDASDEQSVERILTRALSSGSLVKAAGSGHSYSDVATTPDFFIDTHGLNRVANPNTPIAGQLSQSQLRSSVDLQLAVSRIDWPKYDPENNRALVEMEAGITIHNLNKVLEERNLGLSNMGGYDGQTIIGAISTSTHGSGIGLGPFPDMVRSLVLATTGKWDATGDSGSGAAPGIYYYRIEPTNGITDPDEYDEPLIQLIQDDDAFYSTICNMGCFGVIYSAVIEVMQMYWLSETRTITTLDVLLGTKQGADLKKSLLPDRGNANRVAAPLATVRNYEVLIHPYPMKDGAVVYMDPQDQPQAYYPYFKCLVTERHIVKEPDSTPPDSEPRDPITTLLGMLSVTFEVLVRLLNTFPDLIPFAEDLALTGLVDKNYVNKSFNIYNLFLNKDAGFATEIGFLLQDTNGTYTPEHFVAAINRIHMVAQRARQEGEQYQTSPFSLRFVKSSDAHLSMMQGANTAMIEMDMITGTYAGPQIMYRYQQDMYELGGRPHWGLEFDNLTGSNGLIARMYPKLNAWLDCYKQFNRAGTFTNAFTDRIGFTVANFKR